MCFEVVYGRKGSGYFKLISSLRKVSMDEIMFWVNDWNDYPFLNICNKWTITILWLLNFRYFILIIFLHHLFQLEWIIIWINFSLMITSYIFSHCQSIKRTNCSSFTFKNNVDLVCAFWCGIEEYPYEVGTKLLKF